MFDHLGGAPRRRGAIGSRAASPGPPGRPPAVCPAVATRQSRPDSGNAPLAESTREATAGGVRGADPAPRRASLRCHVRVRSIVSRRLATVLAMLAILAVIVGVRVGVDTAGGADAATGPLIGLVTTSTNGDGRTEITTAGELSVQLVREEIDWARVEPTRGEYRWSTVDRAFLVAAQRQIRVLPLLIASTRGNLDQDVRLPADLAGWARFVAAVVRRYGEHGTFWREHPGFDAHRGSPPAFELWNEPYFRRFSGDGVSPERYARLFRAGAEAGRRVDPGARFLIAADNRYFTDREEQRSWVDDMLTADPALGQLIGGVAAHPYTDRAPWDRRAGLLQRTSRVADLLQQFRDHGVRARAWITELGWAACRGAPRCVGEALQARYLRWTLDHPEQAFGTEVRAIVVYALRSFEPRDGDIAEGYFGVLRADGSQRPAWAVVRRASTQARRGGW